MVQQMIRAGRLDRRLYTELVFDANATGNAVLVVATVWLIVVVSTILQGQVAFSLIGIFQTVIVGLAQWIAVSLLLWLVGTKVFNGSATPQTVLRVSGFAFVPMIALAVPLPGVIVLVAALVWFLAAQTVAVQSLMDLSLQNAVATVLMALGGLVLISLIFRVGLLLPFL